MAADGRVDEAEASDYARIMRELDGIVQAALTLRFVEGSGQ